ncbi:transposase [Antarctobacter sp.]|uniref:transposase n=1 Tax=Antarctobacter sp. TaxID=1872577 RepID=UPI003A5B9407
MRPQAKCRRSRDPALSDPQVLFGPPLLPTTGFVEHVLKLVGQDWQVPNFTTSCRRDKLPNVSLPYRGGA